MSTQPGYGKGTDAFGKKDTAEQKKGPEIQLSVSSDGLTATIRVKPVEDQPVSVEEIVSFLRQNGVVYGILEDSIRDFCDNKKFFLELPCARGIAPIDEENGTLEYLFEKDKNLMPTELDDGTVDYRDLGIVQNVKKGDVLCRIIPPAPGRNGTDVCGKPLPFRKGALPSFPQGRNTEVSEDGLTLTSTTDGCIEYKNASLSISEVFIVRGDVDSASGNIDFLGTVVVQGDVLEGFTVKAGGDINVRGMVEGATMEAGGNIAIAYGMNGMNRGRLTAGGSVSAQYIENSTVKCEGDVRTGVVLNSVVTAGNSIIVRGKRGLLAGGRAQAGRQIYAVTIGSGGARTELSIISEALGEILSGSGGGNLNALDGELKTERRNRDTLKAQEGTIRQFLQRDPQSLKGKMMLKNVSSQRELADIKVKSLEERVRVLSGGAGLSLPDFKVVAARTACAGTKITIGAFSTILTSDNNAMKFYPDQDHIVTSPVLPSDRIS